MLLWEIIPWNSRIYELKESLWIFTTFTCMDIFYADLCDFLQKNYDAVFFQFYVIFIKALIESNKFTSNFPGIIGPACEM